MSGSEVVIHCRQVGNTGMTQKESPMTKAEGLAKLGAWRLKTTWRDHGVGTTWSAYLDSVCVSKSRTQGTKPS